MAKITCEDILGNKHVIEENEFIDRKSVYGAYVKNKRILLVKDSISGYWEFPGGGIKNEKSIFRGLEREFFEETGLYVKKQGKQLTRFTEFFYDLRTETPWRAERCFYLVTEVYGTLQSGGNDDDIADAKMIHLDEIRDYKMKENIKNTIKSLSQTPHSSLT